MQFNTQAIIHHQQQFFNFNGIKKESKEKIKMTVSKVGKSKRKLRPQRTMKFGYYMMNFGIGAILFVTGYVIFISKLEHNLIQLFYIIMWNFVAGITASFFSRWFMRFWEFDKTFNFYVRSIFITVIYSFLIWLGLVALLFDQYEIVITSLLEFWNLIISSNFWEFALILFLLKLFVFFASDYFSDKLAFGG